MASGVNGVGRFDGEYYDEKRLKSKETEKDSELENISVFYSTTLTEEKRTDFVNTFEEVDASQNEQGAKFLEGLIENKESLMNELNISEEEYNNLACVAMALATQETGMGDEAGYNSENNGIGKFFRGILKNIESVVRPKGSASSGLTQMKIYDFLNGNSLTQEQKDILKAHGVTASSLSDNNLYSNPDKAAVATMVVLNSLQNDYYPQYLEKLESAHRELAEKLNPEQAETRGQEVLDSVMSVYEKGNAKEQEQIRLALKQWILSVNDSKDGFFVFDKTYNEEHNLKELNKLLKLDNPIKQEDLDYIRYTLTKDSEAMNKTEYSAYGWHNGTGTTGMQLDRFLAEKVGTIYTNPEVFDYDQFVYNVETIAQKYAQQMIGNT